MVGLVDKNTAENFWIIMATILFFNAVPRFEIVNKFFNDYPWVLLVIGTIILIYKDKLANLIS